MREIKFRAWDSTHKRMDFWELKQAMGFNNWADKTVMQYTGLKDKNGVEICEDDIILVDGLQYIFDDIRKADSLREFLKNTRIIGNRFENPELLEGK